MARASYKFTDRVSQAFRVDGEIHPIYRRAVHAGQTASFDVSVELETNFLQGRQMFTAALGVAFFYVPARLVWSDWINFFMDKKPAPPPHAGGGGSPPVMTDWLYAVSGWSLYQRAVKLCYNAFFGEPGYQAYADITDDAVTTFRRVKAREELYGLVVSDGQTKSYELPVEGSAEEGYSIDLLALDEANRQMRREFRSETTGQSYWNQLVQLGVAPDYGIVDHPELLGYSVADMRPLNTRFDDTTEGYEGKFMHAFNGKASLKTRRAFFSEHGYIVGIAFVRPTVFNTNVGPLDLALIEPDQWYRGVSVGRVYQPVASAVPAHASPALPFIAGQHVSGRDAWAYTAAPTSMSAAKFPASVFQAVPGFQGPREGAIGAFGVTVRGSGLSEVSQVVLPAGSTS